MYKDIRKVSLIRATLCLSFGISIGLMVHKPIGNDKVNAQGTKIVQGIKSNSKTYYMNNVDDRHMNSSLDSGYFVSVQELYIMEETITLEIGAKHQLKVNGLLSDGKEIDLTYNNKLMYHTDNEEYISVLDGQIIVSERARTGDEAMITCAYENASKAVHIRVKQSLEDTVIIDRNGKKIVTNYADTDVIVNKERSLPSHYVPANLVKPNVPFSFKGENQKRYLRKIASDALEKLFAQAQQDGINFVGVSGYRSYNRQKTIFNYKVKTRGFEAASRISAQPGHSEHQTGLAIDVSCAGVGYKLEEELGQLKEGIWLKENAHLYGFIIRYPMGKEHITGYQYEPWHIRYVGKNLAKQIYEYDLTYEEYMTLEL